MEKQDLCLNELGVAYLYNQISKLIDEKIEKAYLGVININTDSKYDDVDKEDMKPPVVDKEGLNTGSTQQIVIKQTVDMEATKEELKNYFQSIIDEKIKTLSTTSSLATKEDAALVNGRILDNSLKFNL